MKKIINNDINYDRILVLDEDGSNLGLMNKSDAIKLAESKGLNLFLINPPGDGKDFAVCRIIRDVSKFIYDAEKKKKKPIAVKRKDITLRINIDTKDLERKCKDIARMIEDGCKVKVSMYLKRRDMKDEEGSRKRAIDKIKDVINAPSLKDIVNVEQDRTEDLFVILSKLKVKNAKENA